MGATLVLVFIDPVPQNPDYHCFADARTLLGIPNAGDTLSSAAFMLIGLMGLMQATHRTRIGIVSPQYTGLFFAVFLTGAGSIGYHLAPGNETLFLSRLPSSLSVVCLTVAVFRERVDERWGRRMFVPLVLFALLTVFYWSLTESLGRGDLRPYGLVRVLSVLMIAVIVGIYPEKRPAEQGYLLSWFVLYCLATICELRDREIFSLGGFVSGHTLKHLLSSAAYAAICLMLARRTNPVSV